jgi:hypothetical protein
MIIIEDMLNKIRGTHAKKILWVLAVVIIIAFGLSGAGSYLSGRGRSGIGTIDGREITPAIYSQYVKLAQVYLLTHTPPEEQRVSRRDIENLATDFMVLLWKAKKEKISVSDQEVVDYIMTNLFGDAKFNQETYEQYLKFLSQRYNLPLTPRLFEECVREFIKFDKLFAEQIDTTVSEDEIKAVYLKDNQKAKIVYLSTPYEKFKVETGLELSEIENFYQKNKSRFEREPKVKLKYTIISSDDDSASKIQAQLPKIKTIDELADEFSLGIKETTYIGLNDPIEEIGWQPQISKIAFVVEKGKIIPIELGDNLIIMTKVDEKASFIPALEEIKEEVKEALVMDKAKSEAKLYTQDLLSEITQKNIADLKQLAGKPNVEFKETDYFKYYDYIEGIGLDEDISEIVFSLQIDEIYPKSLVREDSNVIIQLKELTPFDEKDFADKRDAYSQRLQVSKELLGRINLLTQLRKDSNLDLTSVIELQ